MRAGGDRGHQSKAKGLDDSVHSVCKVHKLVLSTGTTCSLLHPAPSFFLSFCLSVKVIEHSHCPSVVTEQRDLWRLHATNTPRLTLTITYPFLVLFFTCSYTLMLRLMLPLRLSKYQPYRKNNNCFVAVFLSKMNPTRFSTFTLSNARAGVSFEAK